MALVLSFGIRWLLMTGAVGLTTWMISGFSLDGGAPAALALVLLVATSDVVLQVGTRSLPDPAGFLLLAGLTLTVNALLVWWAASATPHLGVDGFVPALEAVVLVSAFAVVCSGLAGWLLQEGRPVPAEASGP